MKHWPFEIVEAGKKPKIQVEFKCEKKTFTPEEVSSMVSLNLKRRFLQVENFIKGRLDLILSPSVKIQKRKN